MQIKNLNKKLDEYLDDTTVMNNPLTSFINSMTNLEGKYFTGTMLKNGKTYAEVYDDEYNPAFENSKVLQADYTDKDLFEFSETEEKEWLKFATWSSHRVPLKGEGYEIIETGLLAPLDDYEVYKKRGEKPDLCNSLFITLTINVKRFDGNFKKVADDIDRYILDYQKKYNEIKNIK